MIVCCWYLQILKALHKSNYTDNTGLALVPSPHTVHDQTNTQEESQFSPNISFGDVLNSTTFGPTSSTPSKRRKSKTLDENVRRACQLVLGSRMGESYNSRRIKCEINKYKYWIHLKCLGFTVAEKHIEHFEKFFVKYQCFQTQPT